MPGLQSWYSHGKLLLTGEYLVMEGAKALAIPLKPGQYLKVEKIVRPQKELIWHALKPDGDWFSARYTLPDLRCTESDHDVLSQSLIELLQKVKDLNPGFFSGNESYQVETQLEFNPAFGFGSSSTLVSNLAYWANVDPFELQFSAFGGSAYDVACARATSPLFYQVHDGKPQLEPLDFIPAFKESLFFVYLGQKQRTAESIKSFRQTASFGKNDIERISAITTEIVQVTNIYDFEQLLREHERILSGILHLPTIKERLFADLPFQVKSLGAWGGDFVLVTTELPSDDFKEFMRKRGFSVIFSWDELVL